MANFSVVVEVRLRDGISDPEGATIERSIPALGVKCVHNVRVGKSIHMEVEADSEQSARETVKKLCETFLTNPVIEDSIITVQSPVSAS